MTTETKIMHQQIAYRELLERPEWKRRRLEILERDLYMCRNCGSGDKLQVHHRQYHINRSDGSKVQPWLYNDRYLITLCDTCHEAGHEEYAIPVRSI